jgi:hypothetical protein
MQHEYQITLQVSINLRHKARIQLSLIINVGISIISCPPILKHQKNISTMAKPNAGRDGRLWDE